MIRFFHQSYLFLNKNFSRPDARLNSFLIENKSKLTTVDGSTQPKLSPSSCYRADPPSPKMFSHDVASNYLCVYVLWNRNV